jgi:dihydrofolate synthase/folylpolyglutamate synthase
VLSRIDIDHEAVLGSTLSAIAAEKAAIIRAGLALSAAQAPEVTEVIAGRAAAAGVPLLLEGRDLHVGLEARGLQGQVVSCQGPSWAFERLRLSLLGIYQPANALLAVAAARHLGAGERAIREGLERVRWPGRFQVIEGRPTLVLDAAHNPAGARALAASLREYFEGVPLTLVVGIFRDKDAAGILAALGPLARRLILTRVDHPRTAEPETLRGLTPAGVPAVEVAPSVGAALARALTAPITPVVCVAGSVALVGEVLGRLGGAHQTPCSIEHGAPGLRVPFP